MAFIKKVLEDFDSSDDLGQAQREAIEALAALAEAKRVIFTEQINTLILDAGTGSNKTVPISIVERASGMSRAYSSSNADDIADVLKKAVGGFIEGGTTKIIDGIFSILTRTLTVFLGSSEGEEQTKIEYFVYATEFAIYRVDLMAWSRTISATSIKTKVEQVTAFSYCLSVVDVSKIKWADFVGIFGLQLSHIKELTKEEREEAKAAMRDTWNFLNSDEDAVALPLEKDVKTVFQLETEYRLPLSSYN